MESVPVILHEDDLNAMYFSMENRSPFLDRSLFETAFSIPAKHLIQNGKAKAVLRDAMKGIVPQEILKDVEAGLEKTSCTAAVIGRVVQGQAGTIEVI